MERERQKSQASVQVHVYVDERMALLSLTK